MIFHRCCNPNVMIGSCFWLLTLVVIWEPSAAWIPSTPCVARKGHKREFRISTRRPRTRSLLFAKKDEDDTKGEGNRIFGFLSRFTSNNGTSSENDKDDATSQPDEESTGFFRSISRRFASKETKEARERAKKEEQLAAILERESGKSGIPSYLQQFNTSGLTSAFRNVSVGFNQARDEIRSVRPDKTALSDEERRLEELRKKTASEKRRRIIAQRIADQRAIDRRKRKELEEEEARKAKDEAESKAKNSEKEEDASDIRSNPLSVAQKYILNFFDSQNEKEEWLAVAPKTRISPGEIVPVTAAGLELLLVASKDGSALYCIENSCPHLGTPLEVGTLERRPVETPSSSSPTSTTVDDPSLFQETDITKLLSQDGCEDCIVCPLHRTAFALQSGEVRGEWCPYPPIIGKVMGAVKTKSTLPVFDVRTKGKSIEVRINTPLMTDDDQD